MRRPLRIHWRMAAVMIAAGLAGLAGMGALAPAAEAQTARSPSAGGPQSPASADRDLTVLNKTKRTVNELYVSQSNADQWGDDRLGDDTIDPGKSFHVRLGRTRDCEFDVQVVYDDASHEESRKVNLCRTKQLAFDGSTATAAPDSAANGVHDVTLANNSGRPIQQVFISPADASQWGEDRLGDGSLSAGEQKKLSYSGDCAADLRVVYDNRSAEERHGLNICDRPALSIEPGWTTADVSPDASGAGPAKQPASPPAASPAAPPLASPAPARTATARPAPVLPPPAFPPPASTSPASVPAASAKTAVSVLNQSGHPAAELYVFPEAATDHGQDRLGLGELKNGDTFVVQLDRGRDCRFAAHVVYGGKGVPDGDLRGLDLCAAPQIVLKP